MDEGKSHVERHNIDEFEDGIIWYHSMPASQTPQVSYQTNLWYKSNPAKNITASMNHPPMFTNASHVWWYVASHEESRECETRVTA